MLALVLLRLSQHFYHIKKLYRIAYTFQRINEILTGFECNVNSQIGAGLSIAHTQNIVIGAGVVIGKNVTLYNGVTLGALSRTTRDENNRYPKIEDGAIIYTGAKILGPISIGANSVIGANAVVLKSVPSGMLAVGVPARVVPIQH